MRKEYKEKWSRLRNTITNIRKLITRKPIFFSFIGLILFLLANKIFPGLSIAMASIAVVAEKIADTIFKISIMFVFFAVFPVLILFEDHIFRNSVFKSIKQKIFYSIVICLFFISLAVCYNIWQEERGYLIAVGTIYMGLWFHRNKYGINKVLHKNIFLFSDIIISLIIIYLARKTIMKRGVEAIMISFPVLFVLFGLYNFFFMKIVNKEKIDYCVSLLLSKKFSGVPVSELTKQKSSHLPGFLMIFRYAFRFLAVLSFLAFSYYLLQKPIIAKSLHFLLAAILLIFAIISIIPRARQYLGKLIPLLLVSIFSLPLYIANGVYSWNRPHPIIILFESLHLFIFLIVIFSRINHTDRKLRLKNAFVSSSLYRLIKAYYSLMFSGKIAVKIQSISIALVFLLFFLFPISLPYWELVNLDSVFGRSIESLIDNFTDITEYSLHDISKKGIGIWVIFADNGLLLLYIIWAVGCYFSAIESVFNNFDTFFPDKMLMFLSLLIFLMTTAGVLLYLVIIEILLLSVGYLFFGKAVSIVITLVSFGFLAPLIITLYVALFELFIISMFPLSLLNCSNSLE